MNTLQISTRRIECWRRNVMHINMKFYFALESAASLLLFLLILLELCQFFDLFRCTDGQIFIFNGFLFGM